MINGTVKWFNSEKGFGFIQTEKVQMYLYISHKLMKGFKTLGEAVALE